ncbi:MAG: hypothetical protein ACREVW_00950 [Burkholderiales bacterium]
MTVKLLLCVSADQATAALWQGRHFAGCRRFDNDENGWIAFSNYLRAGRGIPMHIMVDSVDEDYRFETLPHAMGRDRAEMVGRKLKQLYRGTSYYSSSLQERGAGKRKDDRYLFAALTDPELLSPWLRATESNGLPVAGVYPLPMVTTSLIERLRLKHTNLLIVTKNTAGVRQTFFKNLKFRISRLTPLRDATGVADQYYADEISNTRMYLDALTVTHVDDTLQLLILDQDDSLAGLPAAIVRGRPNMQCDLLARADIMSRFGIAAAELDASADALHLHLLGEKKPAINFAPTQVTGGFQRYLGRRWLYAASAATLGGAVLWSGVNAFEVLRLQDDMIGLRRQTQEFHAKYQQVTAEFPQAPIAADNLRQTIELAQQVRGSVRTPESMFLVVSRALDASPQIELARIAWHYGRAPAGIGADLTQPGASDPPPLDPGTLVQTGVLRGEVTPFDGDYKAAMRLISSFATRLAADDKVAEVRTLRLPLNVSSDTGLSGSTSASSERGSAQFEIAVVFKAGV